MSIDHYDPLQAPDPEAWLALDEEERMDLAQAYHEAAGIDVPRMRVHAIMHVIVEKQVAEGDAIPVALKLRQLMAQGLDRHQAIHAIGSVVVTHMADAIRTGVAEGDGPKRYYSALKRLNARKWLRSG